MFRKTLPIWLALAALPALAQTELDFLLADLGSESPARAEAVQIIPRWGAEALPGLLDLLPSSNALTARAAWLTAWATCNEIAGPGRPDEAAEAADLLLARLATATDDGLRRQLLRLCAVTVPEGHDVTAVAALLSDPTWREPARTTLERIATTESRAALAVAITDAEPAFAVALLDALTTMRAPEAVPHAVALIGSPEPAVRIASARALAWTGSPRHEAAIRKVLETADDTSRPAAADACLDLAEGMARAGGNWDRAMTLFADVLDSIPNKPPYGALSDRAVVGLATYGDETVVETLLAVAGAEGIDIRTHAAAIASLELIRGKAAAEAVCDAFAAQPAEVRLAMIPGLGRRGGPRVAGLLVGAAGEADPALRLAALTALGDARALEGLPTLAAAMHSEVEAERLAAVASSKRLAESLRAGGDIANAGKAYAAIYRAAPDGDLRSYALEGIMACPVPEAFEAIFATGGDVDVTTLPAPVLVSVAGALLSVGRTEDAKKLLDGILAQPLVGEPAERLIALFGGQPELDIPHRLGIIPKWQIVGPFPYGGPGTGMDLSNVGEPTVDLAATYDVGGKQLAWRPAESAGGLIDLTTPFGMPEKQVAYAFARIDAGGARDVVLRMGSDDGLKVWVNGEVVHAHDIDRGAAFDQDSAAAKLREGANDILVMVTQGGGGWNFRLRVTTPEGVGVPVSVVE